MKALLIRIDRGFSRLNQVLLFIGALSLIAAALILSYSVLSRAMFHLATEWQDEAALFCLVGTTFICASYVQEKRGHIGISAIDSLLPDRINAARRLTIDIVSFLFFLFFSSKTWDLLHESWVEQQVTDSTWGPPLWIPYLLMFLGMALLSFQLFLQILVRKQVAINKGH